MEGDQGTTLKRKFSSGTNGDYARKSPKLGGSSGRAGKMSFAQKMMAKMGHVEGQGLGKEGEGMVNPIEVKLRPQGAGVGTIKERTAQYKEEMKRKAEKEGVVYEGSSDEERMLRRDRRKKTAQSGMQASSGAKTPIAKKSKPKFRSIEDVKAAAPGLDVPPAMLSSILDTTGSEHKLLTSTAGLMTPTGFAAPETETEKIARRERLELEAFIDAWHGIQEQKIYIEQHEGHLNLESDQRLGEQQKLQGIIDLFDELKLDTDADSGDTTWSSVVEQLAAVQDRYKHDVDHYNLSEVAVGALAPSLKEMVARWEPLENPESVTKDLDRLRKILGLELHNELARADEDLTKQDLYGKSTREKATSAYETLVYTTWLPKLRTSLTNWDVLNHQPMIAVVRAWRPVLPPFVMSNLVDQILVPKLVTALQAWDPRKRTHRHRHETLKHSPPHTWVFPWLPFLPSHQLDPTSTSGLVVEFKRKLRAVLDGWDIDTGVLPGLQPWRDVLLSEFDHVLVRHLLPRLSLHLSKRLDIDPSDQDMTPLEKVFVWQDYLKTAVLARLMVAELFPKWLGTLHLWLTTEGASFDEIGQWTEWWMEQLPEKLSRHPDVVKEWDKGRDMINAALDLLDRGASLSTLPPPAAGPSRPIAKATPGTSASAPSKTTSKIPGDFRDAVEAWCIDEDLTFVPLREAHPVNGLPLFRVTASATGKGGIVVYLQGDVVWAQRKGERSMYDPIGLNDKLVERAEGK